MKTRRLLGAMAAIMLFAGSASAEFAKVSFTNSEGRLITGETFQIHDSTGKLIGFEHGRADGVYDVFVPAEGKVVFTFDNEKVSYGIPTEAVLRLSDEIQRIELSGDPLANTGAFSGLRRINSGAELDESRGAGFQRRDGGNLNTHAMSGSTGTNTFDLNEASDRVKDELGTIRPIFAMAVDPEDDCEAPQDPMDVPSTIDGSTIGATFDDVGTCGTSNTAPGVWLTVIGTGNTLTASTCENSSDGSADYDTKISIFCGECDDLTCIDGNDDESGCSFHSTISWPTQDGGVYRILVHGFGSATGNFTLAVSDDGVPVDPAGLPDCAPPIPTGACCTCLAEPFNCTLETADDCAARGGEYQGDDTACSELIPVDGPDEVSDFSSSPEADLSSTLPPAVDTINVSGVGGTVIDLNVGFDASHTWLSDLDVDLEHLGTTVRLMDSNCGSNDDIDVTFDDEAADVICGSPTTGDANPLSTGGMALSAFDGMPVDGDWTMTVTDPVGGDDGVWHTWSLNITSGPAPEEVFLCEPLSPGGPTSSSSR